MNVHVALLLLMLLVLVMPGLIECKWFDGEDKVVFMQGLRGSSKEKAARRPCSLSELENGAWDMTSKRKSPYCCTAKNSLQQNCSANAAITLKMRRNEGAGNGCYCDVDAQYSPAWRPNADCILEDWDADKFCERLGNRRIILVGDSLADQFHITTFGMTHQERNLTQVCVNDQLVFRLSDTFHLMPYDRGDRLPTIIREEMANAQRLGQRPIFILCVGAHVYSSQLENNETMLVSRFVDLVSHAQREFATSNAVYRFLPVTPAHSCEIHRVPYVSVSFRDVSKQYHFAHVPAMNRALSAMVDSELIIPVYKALEQRPNAHSWWDCLHFCLPGPLQVFPIFLSHLMWIGKL